MNMAAETTRTQSETLPTHESKTALMYFIAIVLGTLCGALHVWLEDPLLTPLAVLASTMIMGMARPFRPWRWIIFVGLPVPIVTGVAVATGFVKVWDRALMAGAILAILVGCAGSIGGSVFRRFFDNVFFQKK
jgi:hypothetical protein